MHTNFNHVMSTIISRYESFLYMHIVSRMYEVLSRILSSPLQRILQPYVDDLFKAVFAVTRDTSPPIAIRYLFDFLDLQAADMGITDPDVLHTWKTNRLNY